MSSLSSPLAPALADLSRDRSGEGNIENSVIFRPGIALHADPALGVSGTWRSPAGRLLELEAAISGPGQWIALHVALDAPDLSRHAWLGFTCRSAAANEVMVRPCLRSGTDGGFTDRFFDKHILADPEPRCHVDAIHLPTARTLPEAAPWRELVLFLPRESFRWHLHDLRPFLI